MREKYQVSHLQGGNMVPNTKVASAVGAPARANPADKRATDKLIGSPLASRSVYQTHDDLGARVAGPQAPSTPSRLAKPQSSEGLGTGWERLATDQSAASLQHVTAVGAMKTSTVGATALMLGAVAGAQLPAIALWGVAGTMVGFYLAKRRLATAYKAACDGRTGTPASSVSWAAFAAHAAVVGAASGLVVGHCAIGMPVAWALSLLGVRAAAAVVPSAAAAWLSEVQQARLARAVGTVNRWTAVPRALASAGAFGVAVGLVAVPSVSLVAVFLGAAAHLQLVVSSVHLASSQCPGSFVSLHYQWSGPWHGSLLGTMYATWSLCALDVVSSQTVLWRALPRGCVAAHSIGSFVASIVDWRR